MRKDEDIAAWCEERMMPLAAALPEGAEGGIAITSLTDRDTLAVSLQRMAETLPAGSDRLAAGSLWAKAYVRAVLPPLFLCAIRDGRAAIHPDQPSSPRLIEAGQRPDRLALDQGALPAGSPEQIMEAALRGHMHPVFLTLRACTGLSPRVAWSNAGNMADFLFRRMIDDSALSDRAAYYAAQVMDARRTPWFPEHNWLHAPLRTVLVTVDDKTVPLRQRRVCCLRDRVPGMTLCATCPRLTDAERRALVGERHRH